VRSLTSVLIGLLVSAAAATLPPSVADRIQQLTRATPWTRVDAIAVSFNTYHPQGLVKIGDTFIVSAVEVHDRGAGKGVGHLFKMSARGELLADLKIGEGAVYHPGGIDYDGNAIWVPVAEYRPDSSAIVYRVDPAAMKATEILRVPDHIGAIVHNVDDRTLHGVSWGSRRFYRWPLGEDGKAGAPVRTDNPSHYVDYQDCKYVSGRRMVCTGVTEIRQPGAAAPFRLGGLELIDLVTGRPIHQVPVLLWTESGLDMTHNPVWIEATASGLRAYFMPEDERSTLYIYDAPLR
jgi:hypothetical protein